MDMQLGENEDYGQHEHLAVGNFARRRIRQPVDIQKYCSGGGAMFELDDEVELDPFDDCEDEYYEEDAYTMFESYTPLSTCMKVMESDAPENKHKHFEVDDNSIICYAQVEESMVSLNEEGTVKKMIIRQGNGIKVPERCRIYYHYVAIAEGQNVPFENSLQRKFPYCTDLRGEIPLLPGFEVAIRSMELHEVARFIVYPEMAFRQAGCPPRIPANAKIHYVVEALQYIGEDRLNTPYYMSADQRNTLPFEQIFKVSNDLRTEGNGIYKSGNMQMAIKKWRKGIQILEEYSAIGSEDCTKRTGLLHTIYANMAQAYLKLEKPAQACNACKLGLYLVDGEDSIKLIYRFAKAKLMLKDCDAALQLVKNGLKIRGDDLDLKVLEKEIRALNAHQRHVEKSMWGNIFKPKDHKTASPDLSEVATSDSAKKVPKKASDLGSDPVKMKNPSVGETFPQKRSECKAVPSLKVIAQEKQRTPRPSRAQEGISGETGTRKRVGFTPSPKSFGEKRGRPNSPERSSSLLAPSCKSFGVKKGTERQVQVEGRGLSSFDAAAAREQQASDNTLVKHESLAAQRLDIFEPGVVTQPTTESVAVQLAVDKGVGSIDNCKELKTDVISVASAPSAPVRTFLLDDDEDEDVPPYGYGSGPIQDSAILKTKSFLATLPKTFFDLCDLQNAQEEGK